MLCAVITFVNLDWTRIIAESERMEEEACETEYPKDFTASLKLHRAARKGNVRKLRRLCKSGINPDAVNEQCQSPLFVAALHNKEKAVQILLASGADPNHPCYDGSTPMHAACLSCSPSILCLLADAGGNINHHDNRGLLPRDWVSYQEEIDKRFKMRKFLEAMRLYAIGTVGDETLSRETRSRWNTFMDNIRQFPERRGRQWRRRRWFTDSPQRRFRPRIPDNVSNFFRRLQNIDWTSAASCFRFYEREETDVTQRDTLRSRDVMKVQTETEESVKDPEVEVEGCKRQLSDSTYPVLTLYVDEKEGKLTSTKKREDVRHPDLIEIEEERSSPGPEGGCQRKGNSDGSSVEDGMLAGRAGTTMEEGCSYLQNSFPGATEDASDARRQEPSTTEVNGVLLTAENQDNIIGEIQEGVCREKERDESDAQQVDRSSTSSDDSCKNRMMEILEDAFKLELAPKISDLMAEYCDSAQGSTAAQESFDIDFHSYHGDDPEDQVDVDAVEWVGDGVGSAESSEGKEEPNPREGDTLGVDNDRNGFDAAEIEIDDLLLKDAANNSEDDDEDERNFIKEGRYVDVQKMLSANLEMVFPEMPSDSPTSPCDLNNNTEMTEQQHEGDENVDVTNGSSLYQVSALNEAAFISDLSLEVNVNESLKSSLESVPQPLEDDDDDDDDDERRIKEKEGEDDILENAPLRSALAKLDLTQAEKEEVQEWFGGHGSVRNLIHNYESMLQEIQCETLRFNVTSLSALLRREYAMMDQDNAHDARRCVSDTAALHQNQKACPHTTRSDCPRVTPSTDAQSAPPLAIPDEMGPDDSWLWPASGEEEEVEDTTFEEQLRRSMEVIGLDDDEDKDGEKRGESGRGDADKQLADLKKLVSPPPPACTPEEHSPHPTPDNTADSSTTSHVNNSGDCDTAEIAQNSEEAGGELHKALTPPPLTSPTISPRAEAELTPRFSPPSLVGKKLVKIDVIRSPTVEAIQNTSD